MWTTCPEIEPVFSIHHTNGKMYWSGTAHAMLNYPTSVDILFDSENNRVGVVAGTKHIVGVDEDRYFIFAKEDLQYLGFSFPLEADREYLIKTDTTPLPHGGVQTVYYFDLDEPI